MNAFRTEPDSLYRYTTAVEVAWELGLSSCWDAARKELMSLAELKSDWNGEGSLSIRPGLIEAASRLFDWLQPENPAPDDVYLAPDGTILLEWHTEEGCTVMNIRVPDHAEIILRKPGKQPVFTKVEIPGSPDAAIRSQTKSGGGPTSYFDDGAFELAA